MRQSDIGDDVPHHELIRAHSAEWLADGGSCIAAPDGEWVVEPVACEERLIVATLDHARVRRERQNFDLAGHYARPDVTRLTVNRARQSTLEVRDG
jgi:nitrilase